MNDFFIFLFCNSKVAASTSILLDSDKVHFILQRIPQNISRVENHCTLGLVTSTDKDQVIEILEEKGLRDYTLLRVHSNDKIFEEYIRNWQKTF